MNKGTMAEVMAVIDNIWGPGPQKPKVVVSDDQIVRDADSHVSRADPNYPAREENGAVKVRRRDFVTVNIAAWEAQMAAKREERRSRRVLDPCRLGLYGPIDEDDE
jgi:hypothetical protein